MSARIGHQDEDRRKDWGEKPKTRYCLGCNVKFKSLGVFNRLCKRCRERAVREETPIFTLHS